MRIIYSYCIFFLLMMLSCQRPNEERTIMLKDKDSLSVTLEGSGQIVVIVSDSGKVKSLQVASPSLTKEDQFLFVDTNFHYYTHIQKEQQLQPFTFFYPHGVISTNYFSDGPFMEGWLNRFSVLGSYMGKEYFTYDPMGDDENAIVRYYNSGWPALNKSSFLHIFYNANNDLVVNYFGLDSLRQRQIKIMDERWNVLVQEEMNFGFFMIPVDSIAGKAHLVCVESTDNTIPNRKSRLIMKIPSEDEYILKAADKRLDLLPLW